MEDLCLQLEALNPSADDPSAALDGSWRLAYASVEPFRSSPFFWAFQAAAGGEDTAAAVFAFTAGLPVAGSRGPFGAITQRFELPPAAEGGRLVSEVAMTLVRPPPHALRLAAWLAAPLVLSSCVFVSDDALQPKRSLTRSLACCPASAARW